MKTFILFFIMILFTLLSSCEKIKPDDKAPDPAGTVTFNVTSSFDVIAITCTDPNPKISPYGHGEYPFLQFHFGLNPSSINLTFTINACKSLNSQCDYSWSSAVEIANIGKVSGLGEVTSKPASGFSGLSSAQKGHGYVIRYRETHNQSDTNLPYKYARFFVVDWLTSSTTGGIIGVTVKYQGPF